MPKLSMSLPPLLKCLIKSLFAKFALEGVTYHHRYDFNQQGQLQANWKVVFETTKSYHKTHGTLPHKSEFDEEWFQKRWIAANDPENPYNHFPTSITMCGPVWRILCLPLAHAVSRNQPRSRLRILKLIPSKMEAFLGFLSSD